MREILFRGKRLDNGEWVEGIPIQNHIGTFICFDENPHYCHQYGYMEIDEVICVVPETVCQYTGLTDRNESKIWENDIVEILKEDGYLQIEWQEDTASFVINSDSFTVTFDNYWGHEMEVIGNIFDDPELLKEGVE